jgi:predicted transcriptional regulator
MKIDLTPQQIAHVTADVTYVSQAEAARILGITAPAVGKMIATGRLAATPVRGGAPVISLAQIHAENQRRQTTAGPRRKTLQKISGQPTPAT